MKPKRLTRHERKQSGASHIRVSKVTHALVMELLEAERRHGRATDRESGGGGWWYRYSRYEFTVDDVLYPLVADRLDALRTPSTLTPAAAATDVNKPSTSSAVNGAGAVNESAIANSLTTKRVKSPRKAARGRRGQ